MNTHTPNYGQSVKARLLNLAKQENIRYQQLVTRYFQERLLFRLSLSEYRTHFVLKGGALLYAYDRFAARPTLDIDFMGDRISNDLENIKAVFRSICDIPYETDGVHFHADTLTADTITVEKEYPGIRVSLIVTLDSIRQSIYMDIGFGDIIIPQPEELDYPILLADFPSTNIMAYSLETVVAEKFQTMVERTTFNSRMKDFFDLYRICSTQSLDDILLQEAIRATFENRDTHYSENHILFSDKFAQDTELNQRWNAFLKKIKYEPTVSFAEVTNRITQWLKPYWEFLKG
ncbi:nucleotidyl transferase AbiEii/AbiGii toxin family protein [Bacteroides neonati]|uniref:nucleotidyl transferase AbiEii/AbiGii toxin family protein n=1 Tax=Bacteroides neonati TaxID=1347393 RepID=UPI0004B1A277|nr:nucleotidyl transferase AbiEii/AbiGii toxin family protein [Bacteroides neonati]